MKKWLLLSAIMLFLNSYAMADVIMLHDGNIYLGKITKTDSSGIVIETFGQTLTISQSDILKSEKNFDSFKEVTTDITLKDGSIIKGKIQNYDEEVGIFVNVDFGTITLPVQSIVEISDTVKKKYYNGSPLNIGIAGGYYFLMGDVAETFKNSYNLLLFTEFNPNIMRGLFAGGEIGLYSMGYNPDSQIEYSMYTFQPYLMYRFLSMRKEKSSFGRFVPFVTAGFGASYIVKDNTRISGNSSKSSELNIIYSIKPGVDIEIMPDLWLRINTGYESVPQEVNSFNHILLNTGVMYSF